ncbi:hypothetical protein [Brevibacillus sp. NRS-1366]|uniref:hypothetical protein n=1 Tax=Brevibacillus sp. NRS-1366 TaxID=3233899 RepID=UPI003D217F30
MAFVADVFDAILIDVDTGDTIATTTLQSGNLEVSVSENEIRGGKGNALLGLLHVSRDINVSLTDAEFKFEWMAKQLGQTVITGAGTAYAMPEWYTVMDNAGAKEITLKEEPTSIDSVVLFDKNGVKLTKTTDFTLDEKVITITKTGVNASDKVEVRTFTYATAATTQTINIDSSVFAKGVKLILETIEISGDEKPLNKIQYQFPSAVPAGNFSIQTSSERSAQAQQFDLKILKPSDSTIVGQIVRIPIAA